MSETLEVNGKKYIGMLNLDCGDVIGHDKRCSNLNLVWKEVMENSNNNNDLSNVNGLIYTVQNGWEKAVDSRKSETYCIVTAGDAYTVCGRLDKDDKHPSAWLEPPEYLNAEPKPCEFEKGDMVIVGCNADSIGYKRYFSHYEDDSYYCFVNGQTEWSSDGETSTWEYCKKA